MFVLLPQLEPISIQQGEKYSVDQSILIDSHRESKILSSFTPEPTWNQTYGGLNTDYGFALEECSGGGFALAGQTNSFGAGNYDGWLVRTDSIGNHLWNKTFGGSNLDYFRDIVECSDGGFALIGVTKSFGGSDEDAWLLRTDSNGNHLWNKTYGGGSADRGDAIVECDSGGFALAGYTVSYSVSGWDGWLIRTDVDGNVQWSQNYNVDVDDRFEDIVECSNTDFAMAGWKRSSFGINEEFWLVRADSTGSLLWSEVYGGTNDERGYGLVEVTGGGFAISGTTTSFGAGLTDGWVVRTDASGNHVWNRTYGGSSYDSVVGLVECGDGGLAIAGSTSSYGVGSGDLWLIRANTTGHAFWNCTWGGAGSDAARAIIECSTWGFALAGHTESFGAGGLDAWLVQIQPPLALWNFTCGGAVDEGASAIVECRDGGFAIAGTETHDINDCRLFLIRIDSSGHQIWRRTYVTDSYRHFCNDLIECSDGGFALAGSCIHGSSMGLLLRTDDSGNKIWHKYYDHGDGTENFNALIECIDGGFALTGVISYWGQYMWTVRTNSSGDIEWSKAYYWNEIVHGNDIVECNDGGFAVAGSIEWGPPAPDLSTQAWLVRLDSSGDMLWNHTWGGDEYDAWTSLVLMDDGGYVLAGYTRDYSVSGYDGWIMRTDNSGISLWDYIYGGTSDDSFSEAVVCDDGGFAFAGSTKSFGAGGSDAWLVRTNDKGQRLWNNRYGGAMDDGFSSLVVSRYGGYTLAGSTRSFGVSGSDAYWVRVKPVRWIEAPVNQIREDGAIFEYSLDAVANFGVTQWALNDSVHFSITQDGVITNATKLAPGAYPVSVLVSDLYGEFLNDSFICTIQTSAPPAWVEEPIHQTHEFGDMFVYNLNATDISGIDSWWVNDTDNFEIDGEGIITNHTNLQVGSFGLQVWVDDTLGNTQTAEFSVTVQDTIPPTWDEIPSNQVTEVGTALLYDVNASDLAGIGYYWVNDSRFIVDSAGLLMNDTFLPVGVYWLELRAYDGHNLFCSATFTVTMEDNYPPQWVEDPTDQIVEYGDSFIYDLDAIDTSGLEAWWLNDTIHFSIDTNGVITNTMALPVGQYGLNVSVMDTVGNYLVATFTVTVEDTSPPIWVVIPTDQVVELDTFFDYDLDAIDPSGIDYYWINDTTHFAIDYNGVINNVTTLSINVYWLEVRAYDIYGHLCSAVFSVTVEDTLSPVWVHEYTDQLVEFDMSFNYDLDAIDPSGIDHWWLNDTVHFSIDSNGRVTNATYLAVSVYVLEVRVYDNFGNYASTTFKVTVQDTTSPVWLTVPTDQTLQYEEVLDYQLQVTDLSGIVHCDVSDTVRFSITDAARLTSIILLEPGEYEITVTVYDPYDNSLTATFTIIVQESTTTAPPDNTMIVALVLLVVGIAAVLVVVVLLPRLKSGS